MQSIYDEIRIEIFKFLNTPISLVLTNHKWYSISQDPQARAEWLIYKYGRAHALFHAVRLDSGFITENVVQALLARNAIISRYFIQRLLMHFGKYDEKLIEFEIEHNVNQINFDRIHSPWASNLPLQIFTRLLTEGYIILNDNLATRGNDMELFYLLSRDPQKFLQDLSDIKNLILTQKFIPFPPRPKPPYEDTIEYIQLMQARAHEEYPPKDGCENSRQLNVIARAILIYPDLVILWKEIGYYEICSDVNELVMQGALLILFPPTPPELPSINDVADRLNQLISFGFQLTDIVMEGALHLFEHRLNEIGDILMDSFQIVHNKSRSDIARSILIQAIKPERNHKKTDLLEFLIDKIDDPEEVLVDALEFYNVGFKFDVNSIKNAKIRSLSVHSNFYFWVLKNYGSNSGITQRCFEDILESRGWIDLKLQQENYERNVPKPLTTYAYNSICSIYLEFCNEKVPFKTKCLPYLQLANNEEIIKPFFRISLPLVFDLPLNCELPLVIPYEFSRPEVKLIGSNQSYKRKFDDKEGWFTLLEKLFLDDSDVSENFKNNLNEFWERIKS